MLGANVAGFTAGFGSAGSTIKKFAGIATAALAAVGAGSLVVMTKNTFAAIDATAKLADRLGTGTEELIGLQHAANLAGASNESLAKGLQLLNRNIGEVTSGLGTEAKAAFDALGLSAEALAAKSPVEAFKDIADKLGGVESASEKAAIAQKLFGRGSAELLNTLSAGRGGLDAMQAEAEKLGITFSRVDAAQVELANDSLTRVKEVIQGGVQQAVIQLAPFVDAIAQKFVELGTSGTGVGGMITNAFGSVLKTVAALADWWSLLKAGFYGLQSVVTSGISLIVQGFAFLLKAIQKVAGILGIDMGADVGAFVDSFVVELDRAAAASAAKAGEAFDAWSQGTNSAAATAFLDDIQAKSRAAAQEIANNAKPIHDVAEAMSESDSSAAKYIEKLKEQIATYGMSASQAELYKLSQQGVSGELYAQAEALTKQLDGMEVATKAQEDAAKAQEKMQQDAASIFEATRTPMEKYESTIGHLSDLLASNAIDWDTYGRAVKQAREELEEASKQGDGMGQSGTIRQAMKLGLGQGVKSASVAGITNKPTKTEDPQLKDTNKLLKDIAKNTSGGNVAVAG